MSIEWGQFLAIRSPTLLTYQMIVVVVGVVADFNEETIG